MDDDQRPDFERGDMVIPRRPHRGLWILLESPTYGGRAVGWFSTGRAVKHPARYGAVMMDDGGNGVPIPEAEGAAEVLRLAGCRIVRSFLRRSPGSARL